MSATKFIECMVDRLLTRRRIRFICLASVAVTVMLVAVSFAKAKNGVTIFETGLGADHAAFYVAGTILNEWSADRLYDLELQNQIYHRAMPGLPAGAWLPFRGYPPLLAMCFRPLALLPYAWSCVAWLIISAALYGAGFMLVWKALRSIPGTERSLAFLLAVSFEPFLMEGWAGGQLCAIGFFWIALSLYCEHKQLPMSAGMALGFCLYKPTLLLLILPLLLIGRRFKELVGLCVTGLVLTTVCVLAVGKHSSLEYVAMLTNHLRDATGGAAIFRDWKFVDFVSFVRLLSGGSSWLSRITVLVAFAVGFLSLAVAWWRFRDLNADGQRLLWAATLTATLVVNVYVGVYDTVLVVIAALLTADVLNRRGELPAAFKVWLVLIYIVPWFSQELARITGFHVYTVVLAGFAVYQFRLAAFSGFRLESKS